MKTQTVRLIDVYLLGPFMIWAGMQLKPKWAQASMMIAGVATMMYNGQNFIKQQRIELEQKAQP